MSQFNGLFTKYETQYFTAERLDPIKNRKTPIFIIYSNTGELIELGMIKWHGAWRKFCLFPNSNTLWDNKCLEDVINLLNTLNTWWKTKDKEV